MAGTCECGNELPGSNKIRGIICLAVKRSASLEGLLFME